MVHDGSREAEKEGPTVLHIRSAAYPRIPGSN